MQRRRFLQSLAAGLALPLPAARAADADERLRIGIAADITTFDPHWLNTAPNLSAHGHVFEALTRNDNDARVVPALAQSWKTLDAHTWEFRLKPGVRFHDGSELTADDVVFSLERPNTLTGSPGPFTSATRQIAEKTAVDKLTVRIRTREPNYAPLTIDLNSIYIVSRRAAAKADEAAFSHGGAAIGTGPYKLARFTPGEGAELEAFAGYHGAKPAFGKVTMRPLTNDAARVAALMAGDVGAIESPPTADLARLGKDARFRVEQKVSWRTLFLHLDQGREQTPFITAKDGKPLPTNPLRDVRVRRAISMAINRAAIVSRVMEGNAVAAGNLVSPPIFGHDPALKPEAFDAEGAKKLLSESGFADGFALTLHGPADRYINDDQILQAVAQMLARIGIATRVQTYPASAYFQRMRNGEFSVALLGWGSQSGDLALRSLLMTPDANAGWGAWNWGRYSSAELDAAVKKALTTLDPAAREAASRAAMGIAMKDVAAVPLHHQLASWGTRRELRYAARTDEFTFAFDFVRG
ncbi:ABC transporter substrate-binding protein [Derxia gummosa]|uniref:ABC transporter substrate-binding protein n=1 Tax=Derxia gummosa DSM 723 TaxID=1121388 RepID=A0A8B6X1K3_9BURK|nr:ABC transporter substrate-binding protein [Derxia gummosa]